MENLTAQEISRIETTKSAKKWNSPATQKEVMGQQHFPEIFVRGAAENLPSQIGFYAGGVQLEATRRITCRLASTNGG